MSLTLDCLKLCLSSNTGKIQFNLHKHYASAHQNGKAQLVNALGLVQEQQQVSSLEAEMDEAGTLTLRHIPPKCHIHKCR